MSQVLKDCFGSVISSLAKMRECAHCDQLAECRAMNWTESPGEESSLRFAGPPPGLGRGESDPSGESPPLG